LVPQVGLEPTTHGL